MWFRKYLTIGFMVVVLSGCDEEQAKIQIQCDTQAQKNESLWQVLNEHYLWEERLDANTNPAEFTSLEALLNDVKAKNPVDRFSYVSKPNQFEFNDLVDGRAPGNGIDVTLSKKQNELFVSLVWPNSSASKLGLERGNKILSVDRQNVNSIIESTEQPASVLNEKFQQKQVEITWQDTMNNLRQGTLVSEEFTVDTVIHHQVIETEYGKVGYLVFMLFIPKAVDELNAVFQSFLEEGVEHLFVDLRYNGGGCCVNLESQIAGENVIGKYSGQLIHNKKQSHLNSKGYFALNDGIKAFDMDSVTFLTGKRTASASEAVITNLMPYIDVKLVGEKTYGKAAGTTSIDICGETVNYTVAKNENADGFSDYFDGLDVTCTVEETTLSAWGKLQDPLLSEAVFLYEKGYCSNQ